MGGRPGEGGGGRKRVKPKSADVHRCAQTWNAKKTHPRGTFHRWEGLLEPGERIPAEWDEGKPGTGVNYGRTFTTHTFCWYKRLHSYSTVCFSASNRRENKKLGAILRRDIDGSIAVMRYSRRYNPYCEKHREGDGFFLCLSHSFSLSPSLFSIGLRSPNRAPLIRKWTRPFLQHILHSPPTFTDCVTKWVWEVVKKCKTKQCHPRLRQI